MDEVGSDGATEAAAFSHQTPAHETDLPVRVRHRLPQVKGLDAQSPEGI